MTSRLVRDERERSVDLAADRLAFLVVCYGALAVAAYRSLVLGQETWDLLALVVTGGLAGLAYRVRERVVTRAWTLVVAVTIGVAAVVAIAAVLAGAAR
jgi:hypothetical protein